MARINEDGAIALSYDPAPRGKYWKLLSDHIIQKFGKSTFIEPDLVKTILLECFDFMVSEFKKLIDEEKSFGFYLYIYWLHEQSIDLYVKNLGGYKLKHTKKEDFATYRRILKLILEQGCDKDFTWPTKPSGAEIARMDAKMQDLFYVGTWMYGFADKISYEKMVPDSLYIGFAEFDYLAIDWKYHYGVAYDKLVLNGMAKEYEKGTFDEDAKNELKEVLANSLGIDYEFSRKQIQEIKAYHSPDGSVLQTIEPYVLPINLEKNYNVSKENAELYYAGLTVSRKNKLSLEEAVRKPYSMERYLFRPILVYTIDGEERALISLKKFDESIMVLATNAIHWQAIPAEWIKNRALHDFMLLKDREHDKILEDKIEEKIIELDLAYDKNIRSIIRPGTDNLPIADDPGEIDFIVINSVLKKVFVCEDKYNRARYEAVGFYADYGKFVAYESRLKKKVDWVNSNLGIVQGHLREKRQLPNINLAGFSVEGIFIINTPTFYMYNGQFKAFSLARIQDFFAGTYDYPVIHYDTEDYFMIIQHPYFRKPIMPL